VAGVLFAGLAAGSLSPDVALPDIVPTLGQIIFVYTIGLDSGKAFFASFERRGYRDSLFVAGFLVFGALLALAISSAMGLGGARAAGLYCGALTSTPALAAARETVREGASRNHLPAERARQLASEPVLAYGLAYPAGVIGVLLSFQFLRRAWRVDFHAAEEAPEILVRDFCVNNPGVAGKSIGEVLRIHKDHGFVISRIRKGGATDIARAGTRLDFGDIVAVVGDSTSLERAHHIFGEPSETRIEEDRSELDFRRVFVSEKSVVGRPIRDLDLQNRLSATITRLRRGDIDVVPTPETRLEYGDRIRVLTRRDNFGAVSQFFGDSIRGTAEADFLSVALGMVLGVFAGMMPIPLPGGTVVRLGAAGGPLVVALVLGKLEHTGRITWVMPVSANLTLRNVGLLLFLAGVGTRAGFAVADTLRTSGPQLILAGAAVTFAVVVPAMHIGYKVLKIPFDMLMGVISGLQTQSACLAFAANLSKTDAPNVGYANVYPAAMITKIVLAQLLVAWLGTGV
jgi:putative transport protein